MDQLAVQRPPRFSPFNLLPLWQEDVCGETGPPAAGTDVAYVACEHNHVFGFAPHQPAGRNLRWRRPLSDARLTAMEPLSDGVLIGTDDHLYALDGATGEIRWQYELAKKGSRSGACLTPAAAAARYIPPLVHVVNHYGLAALDARTGSERHFTSAWRDWRHLAADADRVYLTSMEEGTVEAVQPAYPWPVWTYECGAGVKVAPSVDGRALYCLSHDGHLHVLDQESGRLLGRHRLGIRAEKPPLVAHGLVYVVTDEDELRARRLDGAGESWAWVFESTRGHLTAPVLARAGDALFIGAADGLVHGLDPRTGQIFWRHDMGVPDLRGLCMVEDTLIATARGQVVGFRPPPDVRPTSRPAAEVARPAGNEPAVPGRQEAPSLPATAVPQGMGLRLRDPGLAAARWTLALPAPAVAGAVVRLPHAYVPCADGTLIAVRVDDGSVAWRGEVGRALRCPPRVSRDLLWITAASDLFALATADGRRRWHHGSRDPIEPDAGAGDGVVAYARAGGHVVCLESATGEQRWQGRVEESAVVSLCVHGTGLFVSAKQCVYALRLRDGKETWQAPMIDDVTCPLTAGGGRLFVACHDQRLYALAADSGSLLWAFKTRDEVRHGPAVPGGESIYVASLDGSLAAVSAGDGALRWRFDFDGWPLGSPCAAADAVYLGTRGGFVYALDAATGKLAWKHDLGGAGLQFVPVADGPFVVAVTPTDRLICLQTGHHRREGKP